MSDHYIAPISFRKARALLAEHSDSGAPMPDLGEDPKLPPSALKVMPVMFQPKGMSREAVTSPELVEQLVKILERRGEVGLDPINVFWSGQEWFVVDGHHRLSAYRSSQKWNDAPVPVAPVRGDLQDARLIAGVANSKTQVPMTKKEKSNYAWRLVCGDDDLLIREVVGAADVGKSLVKQMRARKHELLETYPDRFDADELADLPWLTVRRAEFPDGDREKPEIDEDYELLKAKEFHRLLQRHMPGIPRQPEAFAIALRMLHAGLPRMVLEANDWEDEREDLLADLLDERNDPYGLPKESPRRIDRLEDEGDNDF